MEKATVRMQVENNRKTIHYFHPVRIAQKNIVAIYLFCHYKLPIHWKVSITLILVSNTETTIIK